MLTHSFKTSYPTKKDFFELIFFHTDQKIRQKYCGADLWSVPYTLTCWLSISVLKRGFFGISVTPLFPVYNFSVRNHNWGSTFFWNYPKFYVDSGKSKKIEQIFFGFEIIAVELVALNTGFYWERILVILRQYVNKESQDLRHL